MEELARLLSELAEDADEPVEVEAGRDGLRHRLDAVEKSIDDVLWHHRLDGAEIEKAMIVGPPPENTEAQTAQAEGNRVRVPTYLFTPIDAEGDGAADAEGGDANGSGGTHPLIVLPHGGVHSNFSTQYVTVVNELIERGYVVVAPEYRGSTGYGETHYELIDYGGLEIEDTLAARDWAVETCELVDPDRVGVVGWSHGGLHALHSVFDHPDSYDVAYAGVPVSDLVARMGYKSAEYEQLYAADHHVGEPAHENPEEYRQRSPVWNAEKLETPLRIHTTTNDEDVNVLEVEALIRALQAEDKEFEYEIYEDAPGAHLFELLDTQFARESRERVYEFLAEELDPRGNDT